MNEKNEHILNIPQHPRISGMLYNCALNCALPTLFQNIHALATEQYAGAAELKQSYEAFKFSFETWYGIEPSLSWVEFNNFLSSLTFPEKELILAPVIRKFIENKVRREDPDQHISMFSEIIGDQHISMSNKITDDQQSSDLDSLKEYFDKNKEEPLGYLTEGRYFALDAHLANKYFYAPFGLFMKVHEKHSGGYDIVNGELSQNTETQNLINIDVYLDAGHYELNPAVMLPPFEKFRPKLEKIKENISSQLSKKVTDKALASLVPFVKENIRKPIEKLITREKLDELLITYKTTYTIYSFMLWLFSFGYYQHQSGTIQALKQLLSQENNQTSFSKIQLAEAINGETNSDSRKAERYGFFMKNENLSNARTATDVLLEKLRNELTY